MLCLPQNVVMARHTLRYTGSAECGRHAFEKCVMQCVARWQDAMLASPLFVLIRHCTLSLHSLTTSKISCRHCLLTLIPHGTSRFFFAADTCILVVGRVLTNQSWLFPNKPWLLPHQPRYHCCEAALSPGSKHGWKRCLHTHLFLLEVS